MLRLLLVALLLAAAPVCAQVSGQVALASDYRLRGISLTDRHPALQASLSYDHTSGLFAGLFASNVDLRESGLGAQAYAGYARRWRDTGSWDLGAVLYSYPRSERGPQYDFVEAFGGFTLGRFGVRLYASDDYFGRGDTSLYAEASAGWALTDQLLLSVRLGVLQLWPETSAGTQTRADGRVGLSTEFAGLTFDASLVATSTPDERCLGGARRCEPGFVLSVSRGF